MLYANRSYYVRYQRSLLSHSLTSQPRSTRTARVLPSCRGASSESYQGEHSDSSCDRRQDPASSSLPAAMGRRRRSPAPWPRFSVYRGRGGSAKSLSQQPVTMRQGGAQTRHGAEQDRSGKRGAAEPRAGPAGRRRLHADDRQVPRAGFGPAAAAPDAGRAAQDLHRRAEAADYGAGGEAARSRLG